MGKSSYYPSQRYRNQPTGTGPSRAGRSLSPPAFQLKKGTSAVLQRDERAETKKKAAGPSFDLSVLPPEMRLSFWRMALEADTKSADLGYKQGPLAAALKYKYGGEIVGNFKYQDFGLSLGVNPGSGALSLGSKVGGLRLSGSADFQKGKYGAGLSFGAPLAPMAGDLSKGIYGAEKGFRGFAGGLPTAFDDPGTFYQGQKSNIDAMLKGYKMLDKLRKQSGSSLRFGAGLNLSYDKEQGMFFMIRVQGSF